VADPAKAWLSRVKCAYVGTEEFNLVEDSACVLSGFAVNNPPMAMPGVYSTIGTTEQELWRKWSSQGEQIMAIGALISRLKDLVARAGEEWYPSPPAK
jgi:hypothetical protein